MAGWIADKYSIYNDFGILAPVALTLVYSMMISMPTSIGPIAPIILYPFVTSIAYCAQWSCMARCVTQKRMVLIIIMLLF